MLTYHNTLQQDKVVKDSPSLLIDIVANENGVRTPRLCRSISIMFFLSHLPRLFRLSRAEYRRRRNSLAACLSEIQQFETRQMPAAAAAPSLAQGAAAVLVAEALTDNPWPLVAGALAILGHVFPVWTNFKGGKGVAVGAGACGCSSRSYMPG